MGGFPDGDNRLGAAVVVQFEFWPTESAERTRPSACRWRAVVRWRRR